LLFLVHRARGWQPAAVLSLSLSLSLLACES
jgi:hypothetical protein